MDQAALKSRSGTRQVSPVSPAKAAIGLVVVAGLQRSVRTTSSEQLRQPIFREGLDQWRHFEPWLEPLRDAVDRYRSP